MGVAGAILMCIGGVLAAAVSRLIADDLREWINWLVERLIRRAVRRLPDALRDRMSEEWHAHTREVPGCVGKLCAALGFHFAANKLRQEKSRTLNSFEFKAVIKTMLFFGRILQYGQNLEKKYEQHTHRGPYSRAYTWYATAVVAIAGLVLRPFTMTFVRWYGEGLITVERKNREP